MFIIRSNVIIFLPGITLNIFFKENWQFLSKTIKLNSVVRRIENKKNRILNK